MEKFSTTEIKYLYKELLKAAKNEPRSVTRRFIRETTRDSFRANRALVDPVEINKKVNSGITALRMIQVAQQTGKGGERRLMKNITYIEQTRDRTSKIENKYNIQDLIDKQYKRYEDVVRKVLPVQECVREKRMSAKKLREFKE